jgi:hypothetical protein
MERQFEIEERERDRMGYYAKTDRDVTRILLGQPIATVEEVITMDEPKGEASGNRPSTTG